LSQASPRDEELGGREAEDAESAAVFVHEGDLAYRRAGLPHAQLRHAPRDAQLARAHADGARGNHYGLLARSRELGYLRRRPVQVLHVEPEALGRIMVLVPILMTMRLARESEARASASAWSFSI